MSLDISDNIIIADQLNNRIRLLNSDGEVETIAGSTREMGYLDGDAGESMFSGPHDVAVDKDTGFLYVADTMNNMIRVVANGTVTTYAGNEDAGYLDGLAFEAQFTQPSGIYVDAGIVYVTDGGENGRIRCISPNEDGDIIVSTLAGGELGGYKDGKGVKARFSHPMGIFVRDNTIYVADKGNHCIRTIDITESKKKKSKSDKTSKTPRAKSRSKKELISEEISEDEPTHEFDGDVVEELREENTKLRREIKSLKKRFNSLASRVTALEEGQSE
eukprot:TRINITY_DN5367_c0_g1_i1.p1 TRINITY_DN5367_c0_g1~~TRINITY_DN5367_c0_g1_i1.p1  ORF type:complete len:274 (-),score=84.30 TRINITY_DN5367_c0_g1_i1:29-850(-)